MRQFLFVILFACSYIGFAQHYPIVAYTNREGLAQMQVTNVLEDSRGYIWAITKGGLSKFDGERFESFYRQDGLKYQTNLEGLSEDSKGNIWLMYSRLGLAKFDGKTFTNYMFEPSALSNIVEYKGAMTFIRNDSLLKILDEKVIFTGIITENSPNYALNTEPQTGTLYINGNKGNISSVFYLDEKNKKFVPIIKDKDASFNIIKINQQLLLRKTVFEQHEYLQLKNKQVSKYFSFTPTQQHFESYPDFSFVIPYANQTFLYDGFAKKITKISDDLTTTITKVNNNNRSQKLFFGTETGLKCVFVNGFRYFTQQEVPYAWGVVEDPQKNIWIGNYCHSLQKYTNNKLEKITAHENVVVNKFHSQNKQVNEFGVNFWYYNPLKDQHNKLWLPNFTGVLIIENNKYDYFLPPIEGAFFNIAEDKKRNKIIGCSLGGITIIENKAPYKYEFVSDTTKMFKTSRFILTTAVDSSGNYWLGGREIVRYNPETKTFKYYTDFNKKLLKKGIANLTFDSRGGLWAGTFDEGLAKYNAKTDRFEAIFENYLLNQATYFLGQISEKYFMIGDRLNLYIIDLDALYNKQQEVVVKVLNFHNGFMGLEPSQNGFFKDSDGKIWICSGTVLSVLDPKLLKLEEGTLHTFIRKINDQRLPFDYENSSAVKLVDGNNNVKIDVESVGEDKSSNSQFSYRIEGFQENWSEWQNDKVIYLTNMPSGNYTIEVRSKRGKIDADHPLTHLKFRVNMPIYKSPNFYPFLIFLIFVTLLIGILYLLNRQSLKNREEIQSKVEQDRKIKLLQIQTTQAQLNPHFIFNVLATLQNQVKSSPDEAQENIAKLSHLIRSFLNASMFDSKTVISVIKLEIGLDKEIKLLRSYIEFEKLQKDNFDYEILENLSIDASNYKTQPMLIQPFVENAIKHGFNELADKRGKLIIQFLEEDESLVCIIEDNGIGREKAQELQKKSLAKYKSLGTDLVLNRIDVLKKIGYFIEIFIEDRPNNGTKVKLTIRFEGEENGKN